MGGCILLLDQTVFKVGHAQHFAGWWNAAGVLVAGTLILLAIAGRHLPGRVLRVLWAAVPLGYAMLQAGWSLAYAGTDLNAAMPWLWTRTGRADPAAARADPALRHRGCAGDPPAACPVGVAAVR